MTKPPDTMLLADAVHTMDPALPLARALTIRKGRVQELFTHHNVKPGASTRVVDIRGQGGAGVILPGFHEGHAHLFKLGHALSQLQLAACATYGDFLRAVKRGAQRLGPDKWVVGHGWQHNAWPDLFPNAGGFPTNDDLNRLLPDNPVVLVHASGHAALANQRAVDELPVELWRDNAHALKDLTGRPTGVFLGPAKNSFDIFWQRAGKHDPEAALRLALRECLRHGFTCVHEAASSLAAVDLYEQVLTRDGVWPRLNVMLHGGREMELVGAMAGGPWERAKGRIRVSTIKLFADGALGSRTAWLEEPYADQTHSGGALMHLKDIAALCKEAARHGFQVATHAIGDRACRKVLDVYENTLGEQILGNEAPAGPSDRRWRLEHGQMLSDDDIRRVRKLGLVASIQAVHAASDAPWIESAIGPERMRLCYRWRDLAAAGATLVNGSDAPIDDLDPLRALRILTGPNPVTGEPGLSWWTALGAMTRGGAVASFQEERLGMLKPGLEADLVCLAGEPTAEDARVIATMVGGEWGFEG